MTQERNPNLVYRSGAIPYFNDRGTIKMMFMRPSDTEFGGSEFQLAKGKVEDGEDFQVAGLREAREELGLLRGNIAHVEPLGTFLGRTTVYAVEVYDMEMFGEPGVETSEVGWLSMEEFELVGRPLHKPLVRAAYQRILCLLESPH